MQSHWWLWLGRIADIVGILGISALVVLCRDLAKKLFARRVITTRPLSLERQFKGLICLVSKPTASEPGSQPEVIRELIRNNDDLTEALLDTRVGTALKAVQHHLGKLTHCWFVASQDSREYVALTQEACGKYFPNVRLLEPVIVADVSRKIDDVLAAVHDILERCEEETAGEILTRDIVTDITAGNKIMSVGAAMACLDADRSIEYIGQQDRKTIYEIEVTLEQLIRWRKK